MNLIKHNALPQQGYPIKLDLKINIITNINTLNIKHYEKIF
ncbi:MAG: hypothetical protein ACI9Q4_001611 [Sediminicola sp.]|jgi:hypothetical protein